MADLRFRFLAWTTLVVAGCTVVNSFDEVGTPREPDGNGGEPSSEAGATSGGTSNPEAGAPPSDAGHGGSTTPLGGAGAGPGPVGPGGEGGGGMVPTAPPGLIVVSGTDDTDTEVLSVLSPQTGDELRRDDLIVPMFAHDGVRDLWYVATVDSSNAVVLDMRSYDRVNDVWEVAGDAIAIPPPADTSANGWVALRQRFAYLSDAGNDLVIIDSTDPASLTVQTTVSLSSKANGLIGSFGNNVGGVVNIVRTTAQGDVTLGRVQVKSTGMLAEEGAMPVGAVPVPNGKGTWGANAADGADVVITPNSTGMQATLVQLNPNTHAADDSLERSFPINSMQLRGFAYDACTGIAFTAELVALAGNTTIYAVPPPGGGSVGTAQPLQAAQGVFFEPYTRTLIAPYSSGNNHDILAYNLTGTDMSPKLTKRTLQQWSPPVDLNPFLVSVASPHPAECE